MRGRAILARLDRISTLKDQRFLQDELTSIPKQTIRKLVYSTKNRDSECCRSYGGYTNFCHLGHSGS